MKTCSVCKEKKDLTNYNKSNKCKDGLQTFCKECSRAKSRSSYRKNHDANLKVVTLKKNRIKERNRKYIYDLLIKSKCIDCGFTDPRALEFDHVRGEKIMELSKMVANGSSLSRIQKEIDKCEIRCANCHRIRTAIDQNWYTHKFQL
jgi:CRISPR/Cas system-associated protein Cas10 (large subunit of type III CRISPR-Cas system)